MEKSIQRSKQYQELQIHLAEGLKKVLNHEPKGNLVIHSLIKSIDYAFQKQFKLMSDSEVEGALQGVLLVFKYINDKDIFVSTLQKSIARRLLNLASVSEQQEKQLVDLLRVEMGGVYTSKLDKMFQDLQVQRQVQSEYTGQKEQGLLEVKLLTQGIWPIETKIQCKLPPQLRDMLSHYDAFYQNKFHSRKITWVPELGLADLRFNISPQRKKELLVSTCQMLILL